ncbi:putative quinol monooxygenase [Nocardia sp. CA-084685]|uniref:putative quinol monooxygenase n=1 Tax=Nocardia sp. CA-084685 TaxID=3239970 RepID=UPI003D9988AB
MSLHVVAEFRAIPGMEDRLRAALEEIAAPSAAEPGCVSYRMYVNPNDPTRWVAVEEWADDEALETHLTTPHFVRAAKALEELLAEPLVLRRLVSA